MTRWWLLLLIVVLVVPVCGYLWSTTNFPSYRYRLWLNNAEDGAWELRRGHVTESEELYAGCVRLANSYPHALREQAVSEMGLASALLAQKKYDQSKELYVSAISKLDRALGNQRSATGLLFLKEDCLLGLASANEGLKDYPQVEKLYNRCLTLTATLPEQKVESRVDVLNAYAGFLERSNASERAAKMRLLAQSTTAQASGVAASKEIEPGKPLSEVVDDFIKLGDTLSMKGDLVNADKAYRQADRLVIQRYGKDSAERFQPLFHLAEMYKNHIRYDRTLPVYKELIPILEKCRPAHPDRLLVAYRTYGLILFQRQETAPARALMLKAVPLARRLPEDPNQLCLTVMMLAEIDKYSNHFSDAEREYRESLAIRRKNPYVDYPDLADVLFHFGDLYYCYKRYPEAETLFRQSLAAHNPDPNRNEQVSLIKYELAQCLQKQGKTAEAIETYKQIIKGCTEKKLFNRNNALELSQTALRELERHGG